MSRRTFGGNNKIKLCFWIGLAWSLASRDTPIGIECSSATWNHVASVGFFSITTTQSQDAWRPPTLRTTSRHGSLTSHRMSIGSRLCTMLGCYCILRFVSFSYIFIILSFNCAVVGQAQNWSGRRLVSCDAFKTDADTLLERNHQSWRPRQVSATVLPPP